MFIYPGVKVGRSASVKCRVILVGHDVAESGPKHETNLSRRLALINQVFLTISKRKLGVDDQQIATHPLRVCSQSCLASILHGEGASMERQIATHPLCVCLQSRMGVKRV